MVKRLYCVLFIVAGVLMFSHSAPSQTTPPAVIFSPDQWKSSQPPFGFKYGGAESSTFLSGWQRSRETVASEGGDLERQTFTDPATGLKVTAEVRTFKDYDAVEWVLRFSNQGKAHR